MLGSLMKVCSVLDFVSKLLFFSLLPPTQQWVFFVVICCKIAPKNLGQYQAYRIKIIKFWMKSPKNFKFKKNLG